MAAEGFGRKPSQPLMVMVMVMVLVEESKRSKVNISYVPTPSITAAL